MYYTAHVMNAITGLMSYWCMHEWQLLFFPTPLHWSPNGCTVHFPRLSPTPPFPFPQLSDPFPPHPIVVCSVDTQTPSSRHSPTEYLILSADPVKTEMKLTNQVSIVLVEASGWKRLWGTSVNAKFVGPLQRLASTMGQSLAANAKHSSGQNKFVICWKSEN